MTTTTTTCDITNEDGKTITILTENRRERTCECCDKVGYYDKDATDGGLPYAWGCDDISDLYYCADTCAAGEFGPVVCEICDEESDGCCYLDENKDELMECEGWDYGTDDKDDPNHDRNAECEPICMNCQENFPSNYTPTGIATLRREARASSAICINVQRQCDLLREKVAEHEATIAKQKEEAAEKDDHIYIYSQFIDACDCGDEFADWLDDHGDDAEDDEGGNRTQRLIAKWAVCQRSGDWD